MSDIHQTVADLIVDWANVEGRSLTEAVYGHLTRHCGLADNALIFEALPPWAQRRIDPAACKPLAHIPSLPTLKAAA
jgi:hypothetical protein